MAKPGRRMKPTELKIITGNPGHRPLPPNEPRPAIDRILPAAPGHLNADAKREWRRIAKELHLLGLLTKVDRGPFAAYCQAYGIWCEAERALKKSASGKDAHAGGLILETTNGNRIQNPLVGIARRAKFDMVKYATEFGLTPSSRAQVAADAPEAVKRGAARFFDDGED